MGVVNVTWMELFNPPLTSDPIELRISIIAVLVLIFIVGAVGNVASCVVIIRHRSMHTVVNLYLLNLAISDLILLAWIFLDMHFVWDPSHYPMGEVGCKTHFFVVVFLFGNGILTVTTLAIERYFAICHPLLLRNKGKSRVIANVVFIWIFSAVCAGFDTLEIGLKEDKEKVICVHLPSESMRVTNCVLAILMFLIPVFTVLVMYTLIAVKLNKKDRGGDKTFNGRASRRRATLLLVILTLFIFVCWTPFFCIRLLLFLTKYTPGTTYGNTLRVAFYMWIVNCWLSTAVNPIIFSVMSKKFRIAFKSLLKSRQNLQRSIYFDSSYYIRSKTASYNHSKQAVDIV